MPAQTITLPIELLILFLFLCHENNIGWNPSGPSKLNIFRLKIVPFSIYFSNASFILQSVHILLCALLLTKVSFTILAS